MCWWILGVSIALIAFVCWLIWELKNAPIFNEHMFENLFKDDDANADTNED